MSDIRGRFLWYDLNTTDPEAAQVFYTQVLGWEVRVWDGGPSPYPMWHVGEEAIGGVMPLDPQAIAMGAPPHWLAYIGVPDTAVAVERAVAAGATLFVPPMHIPSVGTMAVLADPQQAVFAMFTPEGPTEPDLRPGIGEVTWHELMIDDVDAAWSFYQEFFGWEILTDMDMGPMGVYRLFRRAESYALGGMFRKPDSSAPGCEGGVAGPMPSCWSFYFQVADLDATIARALELGATLINGPMDVPDGDRVAMLQDPQGAMFGLHWMKNPER